jgi:hypothetical protein
VTKHTPECLLLALRVGIIRPVTEKDVLPTLLLLNTFSSYLDCAQLSQSEPPRSDTEIHIPNGANQELTPKTFKRPVDFEKLYRNRYPTENETPKSCPIDPNHTHFILLDDCCGSSDTEWTKYNCRVRADLILQLRAEIEQAASRTFNNQGQSKQCCFFCHIDDFFSLRVVHEIPIVQILIEGGPSSVLTVWEAVKHKTPVIIIQVRIF